MTIYFDENMPRHLAEGFRILQKPEGFKSGFSVKIKYIPDEFGQGVKDIEWLPKLGKSAFVITQDVTINRRKHELELYRQYKIGMFFLRGTSKKSGLSVWQMVEVLAKRWDEITEIIRTQEPSFAYSVSLRGIKSLK